MKNVTGIILAGGKSSRMGSDKGILDLNGKKFIEHIIEAIKPNVDEIMIIANNDNYSNFLFPVYKDLILDRGPIGGIYTGLSKTKTEKNIIVSCDIPFVTSELIKHIIDNSKGADIAVPVYKGNSEPLCAVYNKKTTKEIHQLILNNELKMHKVIQHFITREIFINESDKFYNAKLLLNINTPEELKRQKEMIL